jgi:hypothetical protein
VGEVRFRGDNKGSVELLDLRGLLEKIQDLIWGEIHEGVVHENGFCVG